MHGMLSIVANSNWILFRMHAACGSTREWIYCVVDIVHIFKRTEQLCKLSEYFYTNIFLRFVVKRITALQYFVLSDIKQITGY